MYTKKYLEKKGWEFVIAFGFSTEVWKKGGYVMFVDVETRELILYTVGGSDEKE